MSNRRSSGKHRHALVPAYAGKIVDARIEPLLCLLILDKRLDFFLDTGKRSEGVEAASVGHTHPCRLVKLVGHIWEQGMVELAEEQSLTVQCGTGTKQHRRGK